MKTNSYKEEFLFYTVPLISSSVQLPLSSDKVNAGFPSPAENYVEGKLDLNQLLIKNPPATFLVKVSGDSMTGAGIYPNDILVVDRSLEVKSKDIVIAVIDREFTVKRLIKDEDSITLIPANSKYKPIIISDTMDFEVWGVVTNVIHSVR